MSESAGITLSIDGGLRRRRGDGVDEPQLLLVLECSRPLALPARYGLAGVTEVQLGRGPERAMVRSRGEAGPTLSIIVPDRWMSSRHARLEHSFGRWILCDAGSKNGTIVNGAPVERTTLRDGDLIELGHTLLRYRERVTLTDDDPRDLDLERAPRARSGMATLLPPLARELCRLTQVATAPIPVLIQGETGTGKEVIARALHAASGRRGELVAVNCGAIAPNLVESELFGHRKGAFSGAIDDHPGLVRSADGGTLLLDEIGDLPPASQAALLRVLQEREVLPVGGTRPVPVDLRVVAATHRDLDELAERGAFRRDLLARLAGFRLQLPTLRERIDDLGLLVAAVLAEQGFGEHPGFEIEAARRLCVHDWPLNIRELAQCLATATALAGSEPIALEHLPAELRAGRRAGPAAVVPPQGPSAEDQALRDELVALFGEHRGNVSAVARAMGKDRKQVQRWLKRFAIDPDAFR